MLLIGVGVGAAAVAVTAAISDCYSLPTGMNLFLSSGFEIHFHLLKSILVVTHLQRYSHLIANALNGH